MNYFFGIILFFFSYIIPKNKNLYIFGSINGKTFSGNSKSFFLYMIRNQKERKSYYHIKNKNIITFLNENYSELNQKLVNGNSLKALWNILRAKFIFTDSDMHDLGPGLSYQFGRFNVINLRHGEGFKKLGFSGDTDYNSVNKYLLKYIKHYFNSTMKLGTVSSDFMLDNFNSGHKTDRYKITGLARNDIFFRNDLEFFDMEKKYNLKKYKKIILYVPTRRQDNYEIKPFSKKFIKELNKKFEELSYLFIIKTHQNSEAIIKGKEYSNIIDVSKDFLDIQELLKYSDVIITDYSSIFVDYLLLDRIVLFYAYDYEYFSKNLINLIDSFENCIIKEGTCYKEDELLKLLIGENLIKNKDYKKRFTELKNQYHKNQKGGYIDNILKEMKKIK